MPLGFSDSHNYDLRFLINEGWDKKKAFDSIVKYEKLLREDILPVFS